MDLHISLAGAGDRASRIYRQIRAAVLDGRLRPGDRLPPTRDLARSVGVARNTVAVAYERLTAEGFLTARVGAGTFVGAAPVGPGARRPLPGVRPRPIWDGLRRDEPERPPDGATAFTVGTPDPTLFPLATWRRLVTAELRATGPAGYASATPTGYSGAAGDPRLRAAIARYVGVSRSVRAAADDVVVTQGAQQALDLVGRVLLAPGATVAVEEPGYPPARDLFRALGARVVGVPVDAGGLVVDALPPSSRLVYVTPSHQFPLGTPMSLARRVALLDWAAGRDVAIVEDDYDSEFRFSDRPLDPLQSLDRAGRVVYVGTFSKTLLPALRLGYAVAPPSLVPALRTARRLTDWHGDAATQAALARFIDSGELSRHVRRARRVYADRHALVTAALATDLARWLVPVPSTAGLHVCALLRPDAAVDLAGVLARAREAGVVVERLSAYATTPDADGLVLGYGAVPTDRIAAGLRTLAACFAATTP
jgi:GntR family transcriptional regulator/MocR family aminotransferase